MSLPHYEQPTPALRATPPKRGTVGAMKTCEVRLGWESQRRENVGLLAMIGVSQAELGITGMLHRRQDVGDRDGLVMRESESLVFLFNLLVLIPPIWH